MEDHCKWLSEFSYEIEDIIQADPNLRKWLIEGCRKFTRQVHDYITEVKKAAPAISIRMPGTVWENSGSTFGGTPLALKNSFYPVEMFPPHCKWTQDDQTKFTNNQMEMRNAVLITVIHDLGPAQNHGVLYFNSDNKELWSWGYNWARSLYSYLDCEDENVAHCIWNASELDEVRRFVEQCVDKIKSEQDLTLLPSTPRVNQWSDLEMRIINDDTVTWKAGGNTWYRVNYAELGFQNVKTGKCKRIWPMFVELAKHCQNGVIEIKTPDNIHNDLDRICTTLKDYFGPKERPINHKSGCEWTVAFTLSHYKNQPE
ncbi:hypothetical protein ACFL6U_10285 [Planctomycetota bacterium]